jgi:hypothetical protein
VVAPSATDVQIAWRVAFALEPEAPHEPDRWPIAGLDVGLETMQSERTERLGDHERQRFGHQPLALPGLERVIAEVTALQGAAHDLAEVDHADEGARLTMTDQITDVRWSAKATHVRAVGRARARRGDPVGMQSSAPAHRHEELRERPSRRSLQANAS